MESATYHFDEFGRMTNPPDGSYVPTTSGTGMQIDYTYDANGMRKTKTVTTGTLASVPRNGLHWDEDGELRYYVNGYVTEVGLIYVDGHYYYVRSSGTAVRNRDYWPTYNNGLLPSQTYTFNEYGWLIDPNTEVERALGTLDATHKVPRNPGLPREEHRGFPAPPPLSPFSPPDLDRRVDSPDLDRGESGTSS